MCCRTPVEILDRRFLCIGEIIMEKITSRENSKIKLLTKLIKSKKTRKETGLFVIEGLRFVLDAFINNVQMDSLFITEECLSKSKEKINPFIQNLKNLYVISEELSNYISDTQTPQGVYAICKSLDKCSNIDTIYNNGVFMCLCSLKDPGNVGTIIRTADALGIDAVLVTEECPDIFSPKVLRSTMGSVFRIKIITFKNEEEMLKNLKERNFVTYASVLDKSSMSLGTFQFSSKSAILIGNEANGLRKSIIDECDYSLYIPMQGNAESLNAASAANIIMWEIKR